MRVVLDTNTLISAIISPAGVPATLLRLWHDEQFELLTSEETLAELERVLSYPKLRKYVYYQQDEIGRLLELLRRRSRLISDVPAYPPLAFDPSDTKFVALAHAGRANSIVSGDIHLVELGDSEGIPVVTPRQFLEVLAQLRAEQ